MLAAAAGIAGGPAQARVLLTQQQALALAFPPGTEVRREPVFLSAAQIAEARRRGGEGIGGGLVVRYAGWKDGRLLGHAYFDSHRVRTLPETLMIVVSPEGRIERVELLSFDEPEEYQPRPRWLEQLRGRALDDELSLTRAVRPISGASLTSQAAVRSSRKVLAIHHVIGAGSQAPVSPTP